MQNDKREIIYIVISILIICIIGIAIFLFKKDDEVLLTVVNTNKESKGCNTIYVTEDMELYSFDNQETWQESNYYAICDNGTHNIYGKDINGNIIKGTIEINSLDETYPNVKLDYDSKINTFNKDYLKTLIQTDESNEIKIDIEEESSNYNIKFQVTNIEGKTSLVNRIVSKNNIIETITYDEKNYACSIGDTIETKIMIYGGMNNLISSFSSEDSSIAEIKEITNDNVSCKNCKIVQIICKKDGITSLYASSTTGMLSVSQVNVGNTKEDVKEETKQETKEKQNTQEKTDTKQQTITKEDTTKQEEVKQEEKKEETKQEETIIDIGTISYENASYNCEKDNTLSTKICTTNGTVSSYSAGNTSIATITKIKDENNCTYVKINCKSEGKTSLTAVSSLGATTSSNITITYETQTTSTGPIYFESANYKCKEGDTFLTTINVSDTNDRTTYVNNYTSSNTSIATISSTSTQADCINCKTVSIKCIKEGSTTFNATSSKGGTTSATITVSKGETTVTEEEKKVEFASSVYTCKVGESFAAVVMNTNLSNRYGYNYMTSSDPSVAKVTEPTKSSSCSNCIPSNVTCLKVGTTKLYASTSSGSATAIVNVTK